VRPRLVVERQVAFQALLGGADDLVGVEIHLLVFDTFPEALYEHVIAPAPFPVHAHLNVLVFQEPGDLLAGVRASLVSSIEDVRGAIPGERLLDRLQTEVGGQAYWRAALPTFDDSPSLGRQTNTRSRVSSEYT
jgi:hypothetical protein